MRDINLALLSRDAVVPIRHRSRSPDFKRELASPGECERVRKRLRDSQAFFRAIERFIPIASTVIACMLYLTLMRTRAVPLFEEPQYPGIRSPDCCALH